MPIYFLLLRYPYNSSGPSSTLIQMECGIPTETNCNCQVAKRLWSGWPLHTAVCRLLSRYVPQSVVQCRNHIRVLLHYQRLWRDSSFLECYIMSNAKLVL